MVGSQHPGWMKNDREGLIFNPKTGYSHLYAWLEGGGAGRTHLGHWEVSGVRQSKDKSIST